MDPQSTAQLRLKEKLEALGQLAAGIAHEINTPAQYLSDNLSFIEESVGALVTIVERAQALAASVSAGESPSDAEAALAAALEEGDFEFLREELPLALSQSHEGLERVKLIVRSMNEFSHPGTGAPCATDINHALEATVTVATAQWRHVAEVELELASDLPPVRCLANEINQVFLNIVVNAAQAIAAHRPAASEQLGTIRIESGVVGDDIEVRFHDDGGGIPLAIQDRVFDPFFTTKEVGTGTGQGLAIAQRIVQRHEGVLSFVSRPGDGTCFTVRLPITGKLVAAGARSRKVEPCHSD